MYYSLLSTFTESNQTVLTVRQRYIDGGGKSKTIIINKKRFVQNVKKKVTEKTEGKER